MMLQDLHRIPVFISSAISGLKIIANLFDAVLADDCHLSLGKNTVYLKSNLNRGYETNKVLSLVCPYCFNSGLWRKENESPSR